MAGKEAEALRRPGDLPVGTPSIEGSDGLMQEGRTGRSVWERLHEQAGWAGFAVLSLCVFLHPRAPFYDERPYLELAQSLQKAPSFLHWLRVDYLWPAGPLHPLMHFLLSGGGAGWPAPWLRLPNLALLLLIAWALHRLCRESTAYPARTLTLLLTIPMMWTVSGLALTEVPAMAALCGALLWADRCRRVPDGVQGWLWVGLCLSIALSGRQTYLLVVPVVFLLAASRRVPAWPQWLAFCAGLAPFAALVAIWGGLTSRVAVMEPGLRLDHGAYALGYAGAVACWIAPRLWLAHWRWALAVGLAAGLLNSGTGVLHFSTLSSAQVLLGGGEWSLWLERGVTFAAVASGASFLAVVWRQGLAAPLSDFTLGAAALLGLCAASAFIPHQFSSRYIAMGAPFFLLMLHSQSDRGAWALLRSLAGMAAGFASLYSYFTLAA